MQGTAPWWLKAPRSLEPTFKAGAQPGCCAIAEALHGSIKKIIINNGCKSARVQIAEAARGARLHEEVDVRCGSWWVGALRGMLRVAPSFSISHLHHLSPAWHHTCYVLLDQAVAWPPKWRAWKVVAQWQIHVTHVSGQHNVSILCYIGL